MKKYSIGILLAGLLVLLLIPAAFAWNHSRGGMNFFSVESMTPEQEEELVTIMVQQRLSMSRSQKRLQELREEYTDLRMDLDSDPQALEDILKEIAEVKSTLFRIQHSSYQELKEILTKEQLAEFEEKQVERVEHIRGKRDGKHHRDGRF